MRHQLQPLIDTRRQFFDDMAYVQNLRMALQSNAIDEREKLFFVCAVETDTGFVEN